MEQELRTYSCQNEAQPGATVPGGPGKEINDEFARAEGLGPNCRAHSVGRRGGFENGD